MSLEKINEPLTPVVQEVYDTETGEFVRMNTKKPIDINKMNRIMNQRAERWMQRHKKPEIIDIEVE